MAQPIRSRQENNASPEKGPILYWMSRDQRAQDNHALTLAQNMANRYQAPLSVIFSVSPEFPGATSRNYSFMLEGLKETEKNLKERNIPFHVLYGSPIDTIPEFIQNNRIKTLVTDFSPLKTKSRWKSGIIEKIKIPYHETDTHNIIPVWDASPKKEYGAYTLRPKIERKLNQYISRAAETTHHQYNKDTTDTPEKPDWKDIGQKIRENPNIDKSVKPRGHQKPGAISAEKTLRQFISQKLESYAEKRNDPNSDSTSGLSPYIHFGQISAERIAREIMQTNANTQSKESFLDELIVRRELSDNYCYYEKNYDNIRGLPEWSQKTLKAHENDQREYIYTEEQLENAETHDDLWNAAQSEMVKKGRMHGYMRMYWAKKILEWTRTPEEAIRIAIYLNDKYELDGRDPNGYAGIMWSIGGLHDRAWGERPIYGKIRYMSKKGITRKFNTAEYIKSNTKSNTP